MALISSIQFLPADVQAQLLKWNFPVRHLLSGFPHLSGTCTADG